MTIQTKTKRGTGGDAVRLAPVHGTKVVETWTCPKCGREFIEEHYCRKHIREEHMPLVQMEAVYLTPRSAPHPHRAANPGITVYRAFKQPAGAHGDAPEIHDPDWCGQFIAYYEEDAPGGPKVNRERARKALVRHVKQIAKALLAECDELMKAEIK